MTLHPQTLEEAAPDAEEAVARLVAPGSDVLVLGHAVSGLVESLANLGCRVTAADSDPAGAAVAAATAERVLIDGAQPPVAGRLAPESFDAVVLTVPATELRARAMLAELSPLLRLDGSLIVEVRNLAHTPRRIRLLLGDAGEDEADRSGLGPLTLEAASALMTVAGLEVVSVERLEGPKAQPGASLSGQPLPAGLLEWISAQAEAATERFVLRSRRAAGAAATTKAAAAPPAGGAPEDPVIRLQAKALIRLEARLSESLAERERLQEALARERARMLAKVEELSGERQRLIGQVTQQRALIQMYERSRAVRLAKLGRDLLRALRSRGARR